MELLNIHVKTLRKHKHERVFFHNKYQSKCAIYKSKCVVTLLTLLLTFMYNFNESYASSYDNNLNFVNLDTDSFNNSIETVSTPSLRQPIFLNEFAAYIPSGFDTASKIAEKHGYEFLGQVNTLLRLLYLSLSLSHENFSLFLS